MGITEKPNEDIWELFNVAIFMYIHSPVYNYFTLSWNIVIGYITLFHLILCHTKSSHFVPDTYLFPSSTGYIHVKIICFSYPSLTSRIPTNGTAGSPNLSVLGPKGPLWLFVQQLSNTWCPPSQVESWLYSLLSHPWYRLIDSPLSIVQEIVLSTGQFWHTSNQLPNHFPDHIITLEEVSTSTVEL